MANVILKGSTDQNGASSNTIRPGVYYNADGVPYVSNTPYLSNTNKTVNPSSGGQSKMKGALGGANRGVGVSLRAMNELFGGNGTEENKESYPAGSGGGRQISGSGGSSVYYPSYYDPNYNGGSYTASNASSDYLAKMMEILNEEKAQRNSATEAQYKALIDQAKRNYDDERNEASVNNARVNRWLDENYGGNVTGMGLTNRLRSATNYNDALREAMNRRNDSTLNAEQQRYSNLADTVANYANRYNNLASNLYGQELSNDMEKYRNQLDYDYRRYLAMLGL